MLAWLAAATGAFAQSPHPQVRTGHNQVELVAQTTAAAPGSTLYVALRQQVAAGWHTYWRNPGDAGEATTMTWTLPGGWKAGDIVWPTPERDLTGPIMNYVLTGEVYLPVPIAVPASARPGETVTLKAAVSWLVCKDVCIPEDATLTLTVPVTGGAPVTDPQFGPAIASTLAAAPKPDGLSARYQAAGDAVKLQVTGAAVRGAGVAHAYFFPFDGTVLDQAKPQQVQSGPDGLTLSLPAGYAFSHGKPPAHLQGVVALDEHAVEIDATAGPPLTGAAGAASPVESTPGPAGGARVGSTKGAGMGLVAAAAFALVGGLILNLMPCVFPVLSMKAAALVRHVEAPERARAEGAAFFLGVVVTFLALAGLLIAARAAGQAVGWGFQLQAPGVVAALALVMFAAALNLSGLFEIGLSAQGVGAGLASHAGLVGSFFTGVLAVVVAAPCTAPFMAPAIGWALVQPPAIALAVFLALGVGLAAPFTVVSFTPALFRRLPRPGGWMETVRRVLAFPMYGAAAWLAWVFTLQAGDAALPVLFAAAIALAFAGWCFGLSQGASNGRRALTPRIAAVVAMIATLYLGATAALNAAPAEAGAQTGAPRSGDALPTQSWSPQRVAELRAKGQPVFVDFTAAWCVTCQVNERTALATPAVAQAFARTHAVYLKADWTRRDPAIAEALAAQGRSGVPLYLVYGKAAQPQILPQLLTPGAVVAALNDAAGGKG